MQIYLKRETIVGVPTINAFKYNLSPCLRTLRYFWFRVVIVFSVIAIVVAACRSL